MCSREVDCERLQKVVEVVDDWRAELIGLDVAQTCINVNGEA